MVRRATGDLPRLFDEGSVAAQSDGELLGRFLDRRGDAGAAFGAIVARHGSMVARVCRGVLGREADAEDAFQATFLVLVRRAGSIGERELLGPWLYRVALRVARRARGDAARRVGREGGQVVDGFDPPDRATAARPGPWHDDAPTLLEEVDRLPGRYRLPVVLCHLQGLTHAEAAAQLAWPVGTVSVRLARARRLLADRLARRGVGVPASGVALPPVVTLPVAPSWLAQATAAALHAAHRLPLAPLAAAAVAPAAASRGALSLARRTAPMFLLAPWKWFALPAAALLAAGAGVAISGLGSGPPGAGDGPPARQDPPRAAVAPDPAGDFEVKVVDPRTDPAPVAIFRDRVKIRHPQGPGDPVEIEADNVVLRIRPTAFGAPQVSFDNEKVRIEADNFETRGTVADLDRLVRGLARTDPKAQVHLRVDGSADRPATYRGDREAEGDRPADALVLRARAFEVTGPASRLGELARRLQETDPQASIRLGIDGGTIRFEGAALGNQPQTIPLATLWPPVIPIPSGTPRSGPAATPVAPPPSGPAREAAPSPPAPNSPPGAGAKPEPALESDEDNGAVAPPLVRRPGGRVGLIDPPPPGYFDLPAPPADQPNRPEPVRIGQTITIEVLEGLPGRPLGGPRVVRRDGTISLGYYGSLPVAGLNRDQIKVKLIEHLRLYLVDHVLGLAVVNREGKFVAVPPIESDRVFVDDQPDLANRPADATPRRPTPSAGHALGRPDAEKVAASAPSFEPVAQQLADLSSKLDAALAEIEQLRRDRPAATPTDPRPR